MGCLKVQGASFEMRLPSGERAAEVCGFGCAVEAGVSFEALPSNTPRSQF